MKNPVKYLFLAVSILFILIIQTTLLKHIEIFNVAPNLLLAFLICYSLATNDMSAIYAGAVCGILLDITGGRAIGINALLCTYAAFVCVWICDRLYNNNELVAAVFAFFITLAYELLVYLFNFIIWNETGIIYALVGKILPELIYNMIAAIFLYPIARFIVRGSRRKRKRENSYF